MPYRKTEFRASEYYHVYTRGNNRQVIFFEQENYVYFLRQLRECGVTDAADIVAYCLMPNHYHLLLHLKVDDISRPMQRFGLSYTKSVNIRYKRVGSLFQGRFKAIHVDREEYLLHLSRYIHLNPVVAKLVRRPEDWKFSSYLEYIGLRPGKLPSPNVVLSQFSSPDAYRKFVEDRALNDERIAHLLLD